MTTLLYVQCPGCRAIYHPGFVTATCECETPSVQCVPWDPGLDTSPIYLPDVLIGLLDEIEQAGLHVDKTDGSMWSAYLDALCYLARTSTAGRYFWHED
jgi:hypothetical protein